MDREKKIIETDIILCLIIFFLIIQMALNLKLGIELTSLRFYLWINIFFLIFVCCLQWLQGFPKSKLFCLLFFREREHI